MKDVLAEEDTEDLAFLFGFGVLKLLLLQLEDFCGVIEEVSVLVVGVNLGQLIHEYFIE